MIHGQGLSAWQDTPEAPLALDRIGGGPVLLQLFLRGNPFRGSKDGQEPWAAAVEQLQRLNRLAGLVVYGSPYRWEELKGLLNPSIPAAFCAGQMPQAQREVLSRLLQSGEPGQAKATAAFTDWFTLNGATINRERDNQTRGQLVIGPAPAGIIKGLIAEQIVVDLVIRCR